MIDSDRSSVESAMIGPTQEQAEEWLVVLQAATSAGRRSEVTTTLALDLYAGCLRGFPTDVAFEACRALALSEEWFPPLAKLNAKCEALVDDRRRMLAAIRKWEPTEVVELEPVKLPDWYDAEELNRG